MEKLEDFIKKHPVLFCGYIGFCWLAIILILIGKYGSECFMACMCCLGTFAFVLSLAICYESIDDF